jgi:hypothetical protein
MANEQKRRRIINSRNAPKSGKTFGGSSVSSTPKESLMNKTGTYRLPSQVTRPDTKFSANEDSIKGKDTSPTKKAPTKQTNFSANEDSLKGKSPPSSSASKSPTPQTNFSADEGSLKSSAKPTPKVPTPEVKFGSTAEREMRSAANATRGATSKVAELSKTALANKDILKGAGKIVSRGVVPLTAALGAKELYDSYKKYDELMPGTKPNMSKKSDSIVDAINSDSDASTRAKSRGATREAMYGSQKSEPSTVTKTESSTPDKKEPPVAVVKKQSTTVMKPTTPTEGQKARDQIARMRDIYNSDPEFTGDKDLPQPSELKDTDFKKGGMTKRPPKPAKKVPARKFASGGNVSRTSASKRGDGCATKGHTKGKYL